MITDKINISISENTVTVNGVRYEIDLSANINTEYDYLSWGSSESFAQKFPGIRVITFKGTEKEYKDHIKPFADLWMAEKARLEEEANRPPTPEEQAAMELAEAIATSDEILTARMQRQFVQTETFTSAEFATFAKAGLFEAWAAGAKYVKGNRLVHEGVVYEVQQAVTAQAHQAPGSTGMLAVYRPLSVDAGTGAEPDGSREHPYSFINGMDVTNGKYYTFESKLYLAKANMTPCIWNPGTAGLWQWEVVV